MAGYFSSWQRRGITPAQHRLAVSSAITAVAAGARLAMPVPARSQRAAHIYPPCQKAPLRFHLLRAR